MSLLRWHFVGLISLLAFFGTEAQNTTAARPVLDFSNDACGSPLVESQLWYSLDGTVVGIRDGSTVELILAKHRPPISVHLVGIAVDPKGALAGQAKARVSSLILSKSVEVLVNPQWLYLKKKPAELSGVVHLNGGAATDVGLSLLKAGLARTQEPRPYTVSNYTFCKYREAESTARSEKIGIWQVNK